MCEMKNEGSKSLSLTEIIDQIQRDGARSD